MSIVLLCTALCACTSQKKPIQTEEDDTTVVDFVTNPANPDINPVSPEELLGHDVELSDYCGIWSCSDSESVLIVYNDGTAGYVFDDIGSGYGDWVQTERGIDYTITYSGVEYTFEGVIDEVDGVGKCLTFDLSAIITDNNIDTTHVRANFDLKNQEKAF